jgi:hypothetical protein
MKRKLDDNKDQEKRLKPDIIESTKYHKFLPESIKHDISFEVEEWKSNIFTLLETVSQTKEGYLGLVSAIVRY